MRLLCPMALRLLIVAAVLFGGMVPLGGCGDASQEPTAQGGTRQNQDVDSAAQVYQKEEIDRSAARLLVVAEELYRRGKLGEALKLTGKAGRLDPDLPQVYSLRARIFSRMGRFEKAIAAYDSVIVRDSVYPGAWQNRGNLLFRLARFKEALRSYRHAYRQTGGSDPAYLIGRALARLERPDTAERAYRQALRLDSTNAEAWRWLSDLLVQQGQLREAISPARNAVHLQPENPSFQFTLGSVLLRLGRAKESLRHLGQAAQQDPSNPETHRTLGRALQRVGRQEEARKAFARADSLSKRSE